VLKPNDEYGGKGVLIGWESEQAAWDGARAGGIDDPAIVQERAAIAYEDFPSLLARRRVGHQPAAGGL
jgi:hypothetical protein